MKFTLHTEPSVSPPEFTIIIHTEGGPATKTLWLGPNGVVQEDSDHDISQIIVDTSHNSVYENRLRVRGRESGIYRCNIVNNVNDYFLATINLLHERISIMGTYKYYTITLHELIECTVFAVAREPTSLNAISQSNSTHVNITVTWESPDMGDPVTGYVIYYQPEGGAVSSDMVSGGETETHLLDGLQRGVTYNISIVALSLHLPSLLVGPVTAPGIVQGRVTLISTVQ